MEALKEMSGRREFGDSLKDFRHRVCRQKRGRSAMLPAVLGLGSNLYNAGL
jgi:hypothetical protein